MALAGKVCVYLTKIQDLKEIKEGRRECWGSDEGRSREEWGREREEEIFK